MPLILPYDQPPSRQYRRLVAEGRITYTAGYPVDGMEREASKIVCGYCRATFVPEKSTRKFCSIRCGRMAREKK